ncbi:MAG: membrane protein insertase YidC [Proteobacteria bacterium]|nr:membrane protein insertase YidC [Pseudomonadota bacterium]
MNNNIRVFLWLGLVLAVWLNYNAWVVDYGPTGKVAGADTTRDSAANETKTGSLETSVPQATQSASANSAAVGDTPAAVPSVATGDPATTATATGPGLVRVRTDVLDVEISLAGGELRGAELLRYPVVKGGAERVELFNRDSPQTLYVLQTGLSGPANANRPTHLSLFTSPAQEFRLATGATELRVPLTWTDPAGVVVTKTFIFKPGKYRIDVEYDVENRTATPWAAASYAQILRFDPPVERSMFDVQSYAFRGPAIYDGEKYRKLKVDKDEDRALQIDVQGGWLAALQHQFVAAFVPNPKAPYRITLRAEGREYLLSAVGPLTTVAPNTTGQFTETLFVGPKLQSELTTTGTELDRVADYGMLTLLARPLFWLLEQAHKLVGNWGFAIILVTLMLKLIFYPLSEASGRSMAKMRALAPRIKNLQESYKDEREKLGRAMMELYQKEKINPVAGCLPMLVQMPVFIAFYWVLLESVEMRQAPFMLWINDLSARDPFFILPALNGLAMFAQFKVNPPPPDPIQAKIFQFMPIVFSVMFALFPAGLVLYWVTNTVLSIAQQWNINRRVALQMKKA